MRSIAPSGAEHSEPDALAAALLAQLVSEYPAQFSLEELFRSLAEGPEDWAARDDMQVALRQLIADGLVHRHGSFAFATRAAVRAEQLRT